MTRPPLSFRRFAAIAVKEFVQMRRDRLTFAMMVGIPLIQLLIFGFAINTDPKYLPTAVLLRDRSPFARSIVEAMRNSEYFQIVGEVTSEDEARRALSLGEVQFVLNIPEDFSRRLARGERPAVLLEADATDPAATGNALAAVSEMATSALRHDLKGPLAQFASGPPSFDLRMHRKFNPERITQYNVVPGLMGVVLTMTMVIITALAMTRERERGTIEMLLATPARPTEVMLGKIVPYILVGYVQLLLILAAAIIIFHVPVEGDPLVLFGATFIFIIANLSVGLTFSTLATNQLQAVQMAFFFFLPSILLSGFMFPFRGMPLWAQWLGECLPLTHFLRAVRGVFLKGHGVSETMYFMWPVALFAFVAIVVGVKRYRQTLD